MGDWFIVKDEFKSTILNWICKSEKEIEDYLKNQ